VLDLERISVSPPSAAATSSRRGRSVLSINFIGDGLRDALDPRKVL